MVLLTPPRAKFDQQLLVAQADIVAGAGAVLTGEETGGHEAWFSARAAQRDLRLGQPVVPGGGAGQRDGDLIEEAGVEGEFLRCASRDFDLGGAQVDPVVGEKQVIPAGRKQQRQRPVRGQSIDVDRCVRAEIDWRARRRRCAER